MKRESARKGEVEKKKGDRSSSSKNKYTSNGWWGTRATIVLVPSLAKKVNDLVVDAGRAHTNRES